MHKFLYSPFVEVTRKRQGKEGGRIEVGFPMAANGAAAGSYADESDRPSVRRSVHVFPFLFIDIIPHGGSREGLPSSCLPAARPPICLQRGQKTRCS